MVWKVAVILAIIVTNSARAQSYCFRFICDARGPCIFTILPFSGEAKSSLSQPIARPVSAISILGTAIASSGKTDHEDAAL